MRHAAPPPDTATGVPADLEVHIEELVLHGLQPDDRWRIGEAVERELALLFAAAGVAASPPAARSLDRVDGGTLALPPGAGAAAMGAGIARAVWGALAVGDRRHGPVLPGRPPAAEPARRPAE